MVSRRSDAKVSQEAWHWETELGSEQLGAPGTVTLSVDTSPTESMSVYVVGGASIPVLVQMPVEVEVRVERGKPPTIIVLVRVAMVVYA